jgi:copper homeostasis protein (lipoprotein)
MRLTFARYLIFVIAICACACNGNNGKSSHKFYKGIYSFGPEVKSFQDNDSGTEFWVVDSSKQLELKYSELKFEKPYEPVYIEVEGEKIPSGKDGLASEYDSTLVVRKLIKISKQLVQDTLENNQAGKKPKYDQPKATEKKN